ncbi:alanyl-tRNA synthetase [Caminicella sporogenes DSM 14501]|uniref:Alanyl-tRNA synthetase n=1 Tax=Caminicella sporogenes DSM 14501 TaxID=1121266 RepID=A0A1M6LS91_9FIRM|nr:DHHA1 domain-containing protein [Caminicella sporogenes]RKD27930.1 hypothetical protein BET04_02395 [Caminicella sporogenes]SHJ73962.1 alanyl-tRNA synthetase [Caminicella sporogenes DSM 14501]
MSKKLFYKNPYIKEFTANINHIIEKKEEFHVELNQTAFFPEGGGQPSDKGYIDDIPVSHVYEKDNKIYHVLNRLPSKLENVKCIIDWQTRFDHMQQHLGQHILSSAFEKLHDVQTIGFHLGSEYVTIDIDKQLSKNDIKKVEYFANQIVFNDLPVSAIYPSNDELNKLPLRKKPSVTENIRIVKIDDFDFSPCCGTHPNRTGEVGLIKIRKFENYKGGLRIEFVCGNRALKDYYLKNEITNTISSLLSVKDIEIIEAANKIIEENTKLKKELKDIKEKLLNFEAVDFYKKSSIINDIRIIKYIFEKRNFNEVKTLSNILSNNPKTIVLFGISNTDKAQLIYSRSKDLDKINISEILKSSLNLIDGKGGGSQFAAQGGGKLSNNINAALNHGYNKIIEILKSL